MTETPPAPQCEICEEPAGEAHCTGTTPHFLCDSCFCNYAEGQFLADGAFEQEATWNGILSSPGELPCYRFLVGECDCASIARPTLLRVLAHSSTPALKAYDAANRRLILAENEREMAKQVEASQDDEELSDIERLRQAVVGAMSRGGYVACPSCGQNSQKNDACMHMACPCGTRFCYCCGRRRDGGPRVCRSNGTGCDSPSAYLEHHPGWNRFHRNGELAGRGALHEFHRRRMAYFLREVKASHPPALWEQLREEYPDILKGVPTDGRQISWEEIDEAKPPLFGRTVEKQLEWKNRLAIDGDENDVEQGQDQPENRVQSFRRKFELFIAAFLFVFVPCLCVALPFLGATIGSFLLARPNSTWERWLGLFFVTLSISFLLGCTISLSVRLLRHRAEMGIP